MIWLFCFYSDQYDQKIPSLTFLFHYLEDDKVTMNPNGAKVIGTISFLSKCQWMMKYHNHYRYGFAGLLWNGTNLNYFFPLWKRIIYLQRLQLRTKKEWNSNKIILKLIYTLWCMKLIPSNLYISYISNFLSDIQCKFNTNVVVMRLWRSGLMVIFSHQQVKEWLSWLNILFEFGNRMVTAEKLLLL